LEVKEDPDKIKVIMDMQPSLQWKSRQSFLYQEGMGGSHHHYSHKVLIWKLFVMAGTYSIYIHPVVQYTRLLISKYAHE